MTVEFSRRKTQAGITVWKEARGVLAEQNDGAPPVSLTMTTGGPDDSKSLSVGLGFANSGATTYLTGDRRDRWDVIASTQASSKVITLKPARV
jgi:hypothetical protein